MMEALGFDFEHGRLDVSHHPFCGGVPTDVRMTTRYDTGEFLTSLMGILHETGHGLYEQGLPKEWSHFAVGKARGMAIHESQSLFVEKQIARSRRVLGMGDAAGARAPRRGRHRRLGHRGRAGSRPRGRDAVSSASMPTKPPTRSTSSCATRSRRAWSRARSQPRDVPEAWDATHERVSRPVDPRQLQGRPDAGRPLARRRLRLFPQLHARRHDRGATMGGSRKGPSLEPATTCARPLRRDQQLAPRQDLVAGLALVDAGAAGEGDGREAQRAHISKST